MLVEWNDIAFDPEAVVAVVRDYRNDSLKLFFARTDFSYTKHYTLENNSKISEDFEKLVELIAGARSGEI